MILTKHQLFSHTYLAQLQADPAHDEAAAPIAQGLRDWMPFRDTSSLQTLIDSWVSPVLDFLEFHHAPADDALYIRLLYARRGDETPVGLCYIVPSGQDGSTGSPRGLDDTTKCRHPMAQAVLALRARGLRWGMLTDGSRWRLVDAQALRCYEHYVEVNLDELARSDDPTPLRLFYALFRRDAFTPSQPSPCQGEGRVEVGLDRLVAASVQATKTTEDHLKALVSHNEGIMAQLCLGLVRADGRTHYTEAERDAIYRDATYLLYRMLFMSYAEARDLLPMDNPAYRVVSLTELVQTAHDYKLHGMLDSQATTLWDRLKRLCNAIYESDPTLGIPAYNGGLFDDADKPYLREGGIADAYFTEALFALAYRPDASNPDGYQPIDYRDLSVRHLGSLYEGMIEYKLHIAEETLWARREGKGNLRFLRTGQDGAPRKTDEEIRQGSVYFSQSPGERRATGTYYTPEYIVHYIVSQTVVRGLEERRVPLEKKLGGWLEEIAAATDPDERTRMQRTADEELLRFVEEQVLTFRVCDPAMGSGHFLVNAAHQTTNLIVETLHLTPWGSDAINADPVAWRRRVVERCLYGVDLSLMAVELAKLSLWLASVAEGKPLSFLDHHLRQGNSLIGARLEDLAEVLVETVPTGPSRRERKAREAGQLSMLDDPAFSQHVTAATDLLAQISARVVERVEDVKAQEADYEQVRAELEPYRRLADLWTARHFGLDVDEQQLRAISRYLVNGAVSSVPKYQRLVSQAGELANEWHFFHWALEFPEVFIEPGEAGGATDLGFAAVMGNPPYVSHEGLRASAPEIEAALQVMYTDVAMGHWDLYIPFVARALHLTQRDGLQSFILPSTFGVEKYGYALRKKIVENRWLVVLVDFGEHQVFTDVSRQYVIYVARPKANQSEVDLYTFEDDRFVHTGAVDQLGFLEMANCSFRAALSKDELELKRKIDSQSVQLGSLCHVNPGISAHSRQGSPITFRKADVIVRHSPRPSAKQYIEGDLMSRYSVSWRDTYLDYERYRDHFHRPKFPELFESPKIMVRGISGSDNTLISCYDEDKYYTNHSVMHATKWNPAVPQLAPSERDITAPDFGQYDLAYVAASVNSSVVNFYFAKFIATGTLQGSYTGVNPEDIRKLPIHRIDFTTPLRQRGTLRETGQTIYEQALAEKSLGSVASFVQTRLVAEPAETDFVHDLLAYLAQQMIDLNKDRQRLEREADLFRFVDRDTPCLRLDKALGGPLGAGEMVGNLSTVRHDIEGLRLSQEADGDWLLEVLAKLRDPESGWREHQRDKEGNFIRQWLPAYHLPLDKATGRFYHYAFAHLGGFDGAGKFPGGFTRTTLEKLKATKVPKFVPVDLAPLAALEGELAEVRRKIQLTDDLIDQIVYKLYGLTEEEIAIVEGQA